jgi:hypothetical protein
MVTNAIKFAALILLVAFSMWIGPCVAFTQDRSSRKFPEQAVVPALPLQAAEPTNSSEGPKNGQGLQDGAKLMEEFLAMTSKTNADLPQDKAVESLVSSNRGERLSGVRALYDQRRQLVKKLIGILDSTNSAAIKVDTVIVLGEYRASEAVPTLISHFDWDDVVHGAIFTSVTTTEEVDEMVMPVSVALSKIGLPAIPRLLEKISETDDTNIVKKCVWTCASIEGVEATQIRLLDLLERQTDKNGKAGIQSALDALVELKHPK